MKTISLPRRTAYSYIRFSSKRQELGDSLRRQTKAAEEFCERFNLSLNPASYQDLGVSALRGRNSHQGNLRAFLQACKDGRIERDSVLIVENLDRISRQQIVEATTLFLEIIDYVDLGVAQAPAKIYNKEELNLNRFALFEVQMAFIRANEESEVKSDRQRKVWAEKKRKASTTKLTARCPAWMVLSANRKEFILLNDRVTLVREIYDMCIRQGLGVYTITHILNERGLEPWGSGNSGMWQESYVKSLLSNRAVLGTYAQHTRSRTSGRRNPTGVEIESYYPRIITDATFRRAQAALTGRKRKGGRRGYGNDQSVRNLFTGLLTDGHTDSSVQFLNKGKWEYLAPSACKLGKAGYYMAWEYSDFERLFLKYALNEEYIEIMREADTMTAHRIEKLQDAISDLEVRLEHMSEAIADAGLSPTLKKKLAETEFDLADKQRELNQARQDECVSEYAINEFAFDDNLGKRLRTDAELRHRFHEVIEHAFSHIEVFFEGSILPYLEDRAKIQQLARGQEGEPYRHLIKCMKRMRFIRLHYRNGMILDIVDSSRFATIEPCLGELELEPELLKYTSPMREYLEQITVIAPMNTPHFESDN